MKCVTIFAVAAMLVLGVSATPCTDVCNGLCAGTKQACDLTGIFGALCDTNFNICSLGCGATCGCLDKCNEQCTTEYNTCSNGDGLDLLNGITCDVKFANCQAVCNTQCATETAAGAINQALGSVAGGK